MAEHMFGKDADLSLSRPSPLGWDKSTSHTVCGFGLVVVPKYRVYCAQRA